jgi:choline dehydrogenase-like flavoprotein
MPGWPIGFEEVDSYYARARAYMGLPDHFPEKVLADITAAIASNISPELEVLISEWTAKPNLFQVKRKGLQAAANIDVVTQCQVVKLLPAGEGTRQNGVLLRSESGASLVLHANAIVLASGTVENARILLETQFAAPGLRFSALLGRCFQDHVVCNFARLLPKKPRLISRSFGKRYCTGGKLMPKCHLPAKVQEQQQVLNAACHIIPEGGNLAELGRLRSQKEWARILKLLPALARYAINRLVFGQEYWWDRSYIIELHVEQEPCLRSAVTLGNEVFQEDHHKPVLNWEVSPLTLQTIRVAGRYFVDLLRNAGVGSCENRFDDPPTERELKSAIRDVYHMMGTTRMGTTVASGVVDVNCEVFGLPGVYVAGASVFPTGSFSNPTLTAIALAIRLAEHVRANWL